MQEGRELRKLKKTYAELDGRLKKLERKNDRATELISSFMDQYRVRRVKHVCYNFWKQWSRVKGRQTKMQNYCDDFYNQGLKRRAMKACKLFAQIAGNKLYEKRIKEKVTIEVDAKVIEKKNQLEFLEAMIRELEEKYRIELRKKAILKSQCD